MDSMTVEEKYERLEHMLQYAATKADSLKGLLSKYCDEKGNMIPADTVHFRREKRDKFERRLKRSEQEIRGTEAAVRNAKRERDEVISDRDRLQGELQSLELRIRDRATELDDPDSKSTDTVARLEKLQDELGAAGAARDVALADRKNSTERIVRLEAELSVARDEARGLCEQVETLQCAADVANGEHEEFEALQHKIELLSANDTELRRGGEQLAAELAEAREEADTLRGELATVEKSPPTNDSNGSTDLSPRAEQPAPLSVEGELVSQLGDPLMDSYLRFLHAKPVTDGDSSDE